eukprot:4880034-Pyramimonas_sp.AAC.1
MDARNRAPAARHRATMARSAAPSLGKPSTARALYYYEVADLSTAGFNGRCPGITCNRNSPCTVPLVTDRNAQQVSPSFVSCNRCGQVEVIMVISSHTD